MKRTDRGLSSRATHKRGLQLSQETIRVLHSDELSRVISGCPNFSEASTTQQTNQTKGATENTCTKV